MLHTILCLEGSTPLDGSVYPCLSPCDGCKGLEGDDVGGGKCLSLLKDFQTGTASMARMRHLHQAQGVFNVFVLWPLQEYSNEEPILRRTALQAEASL